MTKKKSIAKKTKAKKKIEEKPKKAVIELALDREAVGRVYIKPKFNYLKAAGVK
tara:strand:+ start:880 stop:1041 length:162 start_codon:yes stop_codon:yes gene_type:complete